MFKADHKPDTIVEFEPIVDALTTKTGSTNITLDAYSTVITTGASQGNESVVLPSGTYVGQRKHVKLGTRSHASDVVVFNHALIENAAGTAATGCTMDAANEMACFEWTGAKWRAIYISGTTITTA
jgi:hypothetical protein